MLIGQPLSDTPEGKQAHGIQELHSDSTKDAKVTKAVFFMSLALSSNISVLGIAVAPVTAKILGGFI